MTDIKLQSIITLAATVKPNKVGQFDKHLLKFKVFRRSSTPHSVFKIIVKYDTQAIARNLIHMQKLTYLDHKAQKR